jgi:plasmid stability protein
MPSVTIRNIPDEVHRGLRALAEKHGRSAEAEIRDILARAVQPEGRVKLGSLLVSIGEEAAISNEEYQSLLNVRDTCPAKPMSFE